MGKTTLWRAGVDEAEPPGPARPAGPACGERDGASFSGLGDLLDPVLDEALAPAAGGAAVGSRARSRARGGRRAAARRARGGRRAPQRTARRSHEHEACSSPSTTFSGSTTRPRRALAYAARRLASENVGTAPGPPRRPRERAGRRAACVRGRPSDSATSRSVRSTPPRSHQLVHAHLGVTLPRPLLAEVHQASGGNPFYALEIVRTLQRSGVSVEAGRPLPVPDSLHDLVHGRLRALPREQPRLLCGRGGARASDDRDHGAGVRRRPRSWG